MAEQEVGRLAPQSAGPDDSRTLLRFPPALDDLDRPWVGSYPPLVPHTYPYPDVPLTRLLDDAASDFPDSVAVEFRGSTVTYRVLHDQVDRFATALRSLGVRAGDRVGLAMPNCPQHVIAFFAVLRLGGVVVGIDPALAPGALAAQINDAGCGVLVVLDPVYAKVAQLKGRIPTVRHVVATAIADMLPPVASALFNWRHRGDAALVHRIASAEGVLRMLELIRRHPPAVTQQPLNAAVDLAMLAYDPDVPDRAAMLTHRNLLANVFQLRLWIPDIQAGREVLLCAVPLCRPFGVTACLSLGVLSAATMVLAPSAAPDEVLTTIDRRCPTLFPAQVGMVAELAEAPLRKYDLTSIRVCLCDGALPSTDDARRLEDASGGRVRGGLAVTEASPVTHANPVYGKAKPDRVGLPLTDTLCALVQPEDGTRLAPAGGRGELAVYGPQVFAGYWRRPHESAAVLVDGWLLTGWLAEIDDEGYVRLTGRAAPRAGRVPA